MTEESETLGVTSPSPPAKPSTGPRGRRLGNLRNVRTMLADVLRQVEGEDPVPLKPSDRIARARALIYGAQVLGELIKGSDVEVRLEALEAMAAGKESR